jgi:hypothetical protein
LGDAHEQVVARDPISDREEPQPTTEALFPSALAPVRSRVREAEELALRWVERNYGAVVRRSVTLVGYPFDGIFAHNGVLHVVEVMYVVRWSRSFRRIYNKIEELLKTMRGLTARNARLLVVVVVEYPSNKQTMSEIDALRDRHLVPVEVVILTAASLRGEFGSAEASDPAL